MASKDLEVRLERIEKALGVGKTPEVSDDELAAYHKVRTALWEGGSCGINETSPCIVVTSVCRICQVCRACVVCRACDVECTCGPCGFGTIQQGGLSRFGGLG